MRTSTICSGNYVCAGCLFLVASAGPDKLWVFLGAGTIAAAVLAQQMPLLVHIYSTNYVPSIRGKRVAYAITLSVALVPFFGWFGGQLLERDISEFPYFFKSWLGPCFFSGVCIYMTPSQILQRSPKSNPLTHLSLAWKDKVFGCMLGMWMILGFGNLTTMPLQIEYMTSDEYSIQATNTQIAIAAIVIPSITRIIATSIWGHLFDAFNFFLVRIGELYSASRDRLLLLRRLDSRNLLGCLRLRTRVGGGKRQLEPLGHQVRARSVKSRTTCRSTHSQREYEDWWPPLSDSMIQFFSIQGWALFGSLLVGLSICLLYPISQFARR